MRLRYDNCLGTLGASLTNSGTTITFASPLTYDRGTALPTITGSDYVVLILEPAVSSSPSASFEIVYLTAYTSGATTGTIARGQEGTSGIAHASGALWICGASSADFLQVPSAVTDSRSGGAIPFNSTGVTNGQVPVYNSTNHDWEPGTVSGGGGNTTFSEDDLGTIGSTASVSLASTANQIINVTGTLPSGACTITLTNRAGPSFVLLNLVASGGTLNISDGTTSQAVTIPNSGLVEVLCVCPNSTDINVSVLSNPGPAGPSGLGFGNVVSETANYTIVSSDNGSIFAFNGSSLTATLPATAPSEPWMVAIINQNGTSLTISPNGRQLNGATSSITIVTNQCIFVWSDGTNYRYGTGPQGPAGSSGSAVTDIAKAYCSVNTTITSSVTKVPLDTVVFDPKGCFDVTTNHRYNCPSTGYYLVNANVDINAGGTAAQIQTRILKNGTTMTVGDGYVSSSFSSAGVSVSDIISCSSGDYLELWAYSSSSLPLNATNRGASSDYLSIAYLGTSP